MNLKLLNNKYFWSVVAIIIVTMIVLLGLGRVPFYAHGPVALWSGNVMSDQNSQQLADPYTFTHLIHGMGFYFLLWVFARRLPIGLRLALAVGLESAWEVLENTDFIIQRYREATISLDYYGDSVLNSISDILTAMIGFWIAYKLPVWLSVVILLVIEGVLLFFIRDSLLFNIIMLVYPLPGIKTWQAG